METRPTVLDRALEALLLVLLIAPSGWLCALTPRLRVIFASFGELPVATKLLLQARPGICLLSALGAAAAMSWLADLLGWRRPWVLAFISRRRPALAAAILALVILALFGGYLLFLPQMSCCSLVE